MRICRYEKLGSQSFGNCQNLDNVMQEAAELASVASWPLV
jgi:hypothetical protein